MKHLTLVIVVVVGIIGLSFFTFYKKTGDEGFFNLIIKPKTTVSVLAFGDVMFDRGVRNIMENRGRDPFEYIRNDKLLLSGFDVFWVNLEGPITEMSRSQCQQKIYNFQFSSTTPKLLQSVGINMVSLANNHTYDCFTAGFEDTKKYLDNAGMDYMGGSKNINDSYIIKEINGKKVAFVGIDHTIGLIHLDNFYPLIKRLNEEVNYIFVMIHWGEEYKLVENSDQNYIAHRLIDNGADAIFGHHPHVIQPLEIYKGKLIFYSLGNFVFDQNFGDTTVGFGTGVTFEENKVKVDILPYNIRSFAPDFMKGEEKEGFCEKLLSEVENNGCYFEVVY